MADSSKLKILYILDIMKKTDENHPLNATQIAKKLLSYGIVAERKSIVRDLNFLENAGFSIARCENHNDGFYMTDQEFEDHELKMISDSIASAKFLTIEDTRVLLRKIKGLATRDAERFIDKTIVIDPAVKLVDKKFKNKFDLCMRAISEKLMISFQYMDIGEGNKHILRKRGKVYKVSPYFLTIWEDEYFLICNVPEYDDAAPFRIEMMSNVEMLDETARSISEIKELKNIGKKGYTIADYVRETVHLWSGARHEITISGDNAVRQDVMRKFGNNLMFKDMSNDRFRVTFMIGASEGFYQWIAKYGNLLKIENPKEDINGYIDFLSKTIEQYDTGNV